MALLYNKANLLDRAAPDDKIQLKASITSDNLFQSDTVLGKNESLYESTRQDILMNECLDVDQCFSYVNLYVSWLLPAATHCLISICVCVLLFS